MQHFVQIFIRYCAASATKASIFGAMVLIALSLTNCASTGGDSDFSSPQRASGSKVLACKSGDQMVASSTQCLLDSAACYELANGKWCTGERGNTCPAGSSQVPAGAACPNGTRCIQFGEGLNCAIQVR